MVRASESVLESLALESEAAYENEAAVIEGDRGSNPAFIAMLMEALEKERASLDLLKKATNIASRTRASTSCY